MDPYQKGKVSVIIGLYNVSRFLEQKRLSCILRQSWSDLEILLVNDGSTDETLEICRQLASEDSRIRLIDKPNGGLGSARNAGLDAASGAFVWFYDVDDDVELDLIEKNVLWMQEYGVDMTIFGMHYVYPDTGYRETSHFVDRLVESNDALKSVFADEILMVPNGNGFVINKFYRKDFLDRFGFRFGWQRIQQDELFNLQLYPSVERLYISSEPLYHYHIYNTGNNRSRYIPDRIRIYESIFDGLMSLRDGWGIQDARLVDYAYRRFYQGINSSVLFNTFHRDAPRSPQWKREEIRSILNRAKVRDCLDYFVGHNHFNLEGRLYFRAYRACCYPAICFLRKVSGILRKVKHALF